MIAQYPAINSRSVLGNTLLLTLCSLLGSTAGLLIQIVIAATFGAGFNLDTYWIALAIPLAIGSITTGLSSAIVVPLVIQQKVKSGEESARAAAISSSAITFLILLVPTLMGVLFPDWIVALSAPGLAQSEWRQCVSLARLLYPNIIFIGMSGLLWGLYYAKSQYKIPALAPLMGQGTLLVLIPVLSPRWGITGLAVATTFGYFCQFLFSLPILFRIFRVHLFALGIRNKDVIVAFKQSVPLLIWIGASNILPIVDRYFGSYLPSASISYLTYSSVLYAALGALFGRSLANVIFPVFSDHVANAKTEAMRLLLIRSLHILISVLVPMVAFVVVFAMPLVVVFFEHGKFDREDSLALVLVLPWYLLTIVPLSINYILTRVYNAWQDAQTPAAIAVIAFFAYLALCIYWVPRVSYLAMGIASLCFQSISMLLSLLVLSKRLGGLKTYYLGRQLIFTVILAAGLSLFSKRVVELAPLRAEWLDLLGGGAIYVVLFVILAYRLGLFSELLVMLKPVQVSAKRLVD